MLLACMIWTARESVPAATSAACRDNLRTELAAPPTADDNEGKLRIAGVYLKAGAAWAAYFASLSLALREACCRGGQSSRAG